MIHAPDFIHSVCIRIPEEYIKPNSAWAVGAMSFALIGMTFTLGTLIIFIQYNDTPLSFVLLLGILLCYTVTFVFMIRPSPSVCFIQEFMIGLCFSIVYGALLTKTNRISRIFNSPNQRPTFISPQSQLAICAGFVFIQIFINVVSFLFSQPEAIHHYPTREDNLLVCK
ncbi:Metabotropic glutamate receptor 8, partial [Caligus rogercresseyi]